MLLILLLSKRIVHSSLLMMHLFIDLIIIYGVSGCEVGVPNEVTSYSVNRYGSSSGTQVYLGLENSASCGGYLRNYTICQLNRVVGRDATSCNLSIWEPAEPFVDSLRAFMKVDYIKILLKSCVVIDSRLRDCATTDSE